MEIGAGRVTIEPGKQEGGGSEIAVSEAGRSAGEKDVIFCIELVAGHEE